MMMMMRSRTMVFVALLGLAGCAQAGGPVFGDWRGRQPTGGGLYAANVDLVLHGPPGATEGEYDFQANRLDATFTDIGDRNLIWGDRWTLSQATPGAAPVLELHNLPASQISRYALLPDGVLVPLTRAGLPDTSRYSLHFALAPVPRSNRSFGRL